MATWQIERDDRRLALSGELRIADASPIWAALREGAKDPGPRLDLDLSRATVVDGAIMALLVDLRASLVAHGSRSELVGVSAQLDPLVRLYAGTAPVAVPAPVPHEMAIERFGAVVERRFFRMRSLGGLFLDIVDSLGSIIRSPRLVNWRSVEQLVERAGTDGIPIVMLINFLVGLVMALQALPTLRLYGAQIYVADIVGVAVTRELGPLMTGIIISGRSGAAFAAELGTMRVNEEIDALQTMGFKPTAYLVVPRVIALAIVAPVLTLIGDVIGVSGGAAVATAKLGITLHGFLSEMRTIVATADVWTGLVKGMAFGIAIALIGCEQGLSTRGSASAVGRSTTATVVQCLFTLVVLDALFAILFQWLGV